MAKEANAFELTTVKEIFRKFQKLLTDKKKKKKSMVRSFLRNTCVQ